MVTQPTLVAAAYDAHHLYLAFLCLDQAIRPRTAETAKHDGPVWRDDCVEFFVAPGTAAGDWFQIVVNPAGTTYDAIGFRQDKWEPQTKIAVAQDERFWAVELAVPLSAFPVPAPAPGTQWSVNFTRNRRHFTQSTISVWRFADGQNTNTARFGKLRFE